MRAPHRNRDPFQSRRRKRNNRESIRSAAREAAEDQNQASVLHLSQKRRSDHRTLSASRTRLHTACSFPRRERKGPSCSGANTSRSCRSRASTESRADSRRNPTPPSQEALAKAALDFVGYPREIRLKPASATIYSYSHPSITAIG